jgi:hypothetical protein
MNWSWLSDKLLRWTLYSVAVSALVPIGFNLVLDIGSQSPHSFRDLLGEGDFLLVSVALNSAAVGELIGRSTLPRQSRLELTAAWVSGGLALFAALWYASIHSGGQWSKLTVAWLSVIFLVATLFSTGACVQLSAD